TITPQVPPSPAAPLPAVARPGLPPASEPCSLNRWRGKKPDIAGERIEVREHAWSMATELVLDFHLPGAKTGDQDHLTFYKAVATHIWRHCPKAGLGSKNGLMVIDRPADTSSCQAIDKAVHEIATLTIFVQMIGGDLNHVCRLIHEQPQMVEDLDHIFGASQRRFFAAAYDSEN